MDQHDKLEDVLLVKIEANPDGTTDTKDLAILKKHEALKQNLQDKMDVLVLKSFTLYQQIFPPTLHSKWDEIV